nr:MAG TPA: hypothetical protein [Caudoviricetes sp.]
MPVFLRVPRGRKVLQLHIRPWGKAALPAWEGLHRKEGKNEKQETEFNIIALSLYSIYNIILYLVCIVYIYTGI